MQLVEAGKVELDAPVQRYLPWFRVADEEASAQITVRHLLNQTSGLSTKTGRSFQGSGDTSDAALERVVRKLRSAELTAPVGEKYQYSTINYSVLGLIVQTVAGRSYESYVQTEIFDPLQMRDSFTSEAAAEQDGLATGHNYWFGRPRAADLPYSRRLIPAGYLISSAEDMTHHLIAQLNGGRYSTASVLSPAGVAELHQPGAPTPKTGTSYAMGWFVGPINKIPAIYHQGEVPNFHANAVLVPESRTGVIVLMNAQNNVDLFSVDRMATISEGVTSRLVVADRALTSGEPCLGTPRAGALAQAVRGVAPRACPRVSGPRLHPHHQRRGRPRLGPRQGDLGVLGAPQSEAERARCPGRCDLSKSSLREKGAVVQTVVIQEEPQDGARPAAVVTATGITRRYGEGDTAVDALRGVSLEIARGKLTAVMGPSGSGKSTLMHILAGLDKPTEGKVAIAGTEITELNDTQLTRLRREHIGFIFQFFNLLPMLTARENIVLPLNLAGTSSKNGWVEELSTKVGLTERLSHRPAELSGGQQQRVAIARALVSRPTVMF